MLSMGALSVCLVFCWLEGLMGRMSPFPSRHGIIQEPTIAFGSSVGGATGWQSTRTKSLCLDDALSKTWRQGTRDARHMERSHGNVFLGHLLAFRPVSRKRAIVYKFFHTPKRPRPKLWSIFLAAFLLFPQNLSADLAGGDRVTSLSTIMFGRDNLIMHYLQAEQFFPRVWRLSFSCSAQGTSPIFGVSGGLGGGCIPPHRARLPKGGC